MLFFKKTKPKERYFLISYAHTTGFGEFGLIHTNFPRRSEIKKLNLGVESPVVVNILEVSKEDYFEFNGFDNDDVARQASKVYLPI